MSNDESIRGMVDSFYSDVTRFANRLSEEVQKEMDGAVSKIFHEFGDYQRVRIEQIFRDAVDQFYEAYTPTVYSRQGGLYDILEMHISKDGTVDTGMDESYMELLNPDNLHPDRSGGSLFDKVFMQGYHGGAESISAQKASVWGSHPFPGIPHYRKPGWVKYPGETKKKWHKYGKWGRQAVKTRSPYSIFASNLSVAESTEMYQKLDEIARRNFNESIDSFKKNTVPKVYSEIFK